MTQKTLWLFDHLDLAKSPFVNTVLRQNLAETKVLTLRLDLSLRPG